MFTDFDDVIFFGSNIPNEVKQIINSANESVDASFDNEDQKKAYHLGVTNTLSILKQLLDESIRRDCIVFYCPEVETSEEMTPDEVIEWLETLPY